MAKATVFLICVDVKYSLADDFKMAAHYVSVLAFTDDQAQDAAMVYAEAHPLPEFIKECKVRAIKACTVRKLAEVDGIAASVVMGR